MEKLPHLLPIDSQEFGGYFSLDLPDFGDQFLDMYKVQSGRAAIRAVIESANVRTILIPAYICDSVIEAAQDANVEVELYNLDNNFFPKNIPCDLPDATALLYVNYFGLCERQVEKILNHFNPSKVIIDNSQALFSQPRQCLATIYSARKFLGVPDGGLIATGLKLNALVRDELSIDRIRHLLLRTAYKAASGYASYAEAERSLIDTKPKEISYLTERLLRSINIKSFRTKRQENFKQLATNLDGYNLIAWKHEELAPLNYPLLLPHNTDELKANLAAIGVYIPTYWKEAKSRLASNSFEYSLIDNLLCIPCDQRYELQQITHLLKTITDYLNNL